VRDEISGCEDFRISGFEDYEFRILRNSGSIAGFQDLRQR
jgi:hypothetical protein